MALVVIHAGVRLSDGEAQLLDHICLDLSSDEIAPLMDRSARAIRMLTIRLFNKLGMKNRSGLMVWALKTKYVKLSDIKIPSLPSRDDIRLTTEEGRFLKFVCLDMSYAEIARYMNKSNWAIRDRACRLYKKVGVRTRFGLIIWALKMKFVKLSDIKIEYDHHI